MTALHKLTAPVVAHVLKADGIAGAERHLLTLLPGLRERGFDVRLILLHPPTQPLADYTALLTAGGVPVTRIPIHSHLDFGVIRRIRAALRPLAPQIVHTHLLHADLYGLLAALRLPGRPLRITSRHNDDVFRRRLPFRLLNAALWRFVLTGGIGISDAVTRFCLAVENAPPGKIHTIHYGLPFPLPLIDRKAVRAELRGALNLPADTVLIGGVGRLIEQKGYTYALQAFALLERDFPAAQLVLIGDGPLKTPLHAEARRLGLARRVHFMGWRADAAALMAGLDVFVMPSLWEGFGLVLLEAMASGLPIVATAVSAIPEIVVEGETGLLVPPRDPAALAAALRVLLADPALARHFGLLGEDRLEEHFSADGMITAVVEWYHALLR